VQSESPVNTPRCVPGKSSPLLGGGRNKESEVTITLVANAGVMIGHGGVGFLVDGVHHEMDQPFSPVPADDLKLMRRGGGLFTNLDYLLFTHEHLDHFSPLHVAELLKVRPIKGIFLPDPLSGSKELMLLHQQVRQHAIPCWTLGLAPQESRRIMLPGGHTVTVIGTRHMGQQFRTVRNDCFLLTLGGRNLLFTGDADHIPDYFAAPLDGLHVDAVLVNPIFYHHPNGQHIINSISPRHVVIYHMPFAVDDRMHLTYMVNSDLSRYARPGIQTHVMNKARQSLVLSSL